MNSDGIKKVHNPQVISTEQIDWLRRTICFRGNRRRAENVPLAVVSVQNLIHGPANLCG